MEKEQIPKSIFWGKIKRLKSGNEKKNDLFNGRKFILTDKQKKIVDDVVKDLSSDSPKRKIKKKRKSKNLRQDNKKVHNDSTRAIAIHKSNSKLRKLNQRICPFCNKPISNNSFYIHKKKCAEQ